jgi:hypothetical protein
MAKLDIFEQVRNMGLPEVNRRYQEFFSLSRTDPELYESLLESARNFMYDRTFCMGVGADYVHMKKIDQRRIHVAMHLFRGEQGTRV